MQLRFLEGNFEHGRFKLQHRDNHQEPWADVPCAKEEKPKVWCDHIRFEYGRWYVHGGGWGLNMTSESRYCPVCGAEKPEE